MVRAPIVLAINYFPSTRPSWLTFEARSDEGGKSESSSELVKATRHTRRQRISGKTSRLQLS